MQCKHICSLAQHDGNHLISADWTHSEDEHAAAYGRAGLTQWAENCLSEAGLPSEPAHQGSLQASVALQPASVVQATVSDVVLSLPHDQDFGRAERFCELWSKAFGQVSSSLCRRSAFAKNPGTCNLGLGLRLSCHLVATLSLIPLGRLYYMCCSFQNMSALPMQQWKPFIVNFREVKIYTRLSRTLYCDKDGVSQHA